MKGEQSGIHPRSGQSPTLQNTTLQKRVRLDDLRVVLRLFSATAIAQLSFYQNWMWLSFHQDV